MALTAKIFTTGRGQSVRLPCDGPDRKPAIVIRPGA